MKDWNKMKEDSSKYYQEEYRKNMILKACEYCANYSTIDFLNEPVSGCICGIDPMKCVLNPITMGG